MLAELDLDKLNADEKAELLELLEAKEKLEAENKLAGYKPYPKQAEFHKAGAEFRERLLQASNQCLSPWTFIETASGLRHCAEVFASPGAHVVALADGSERDGRVLRGTLRGLEPAYRVVMASGQFFDCSANHRVAVESGWISLGQLVSLSSGRHCWRKAEDFQASCVADGYLCDPQLPLAEGSDLEKLLGKADARNSSLCFSHKDAEARTRRCTSASLQCDRLTIADDGRHRLADLYGQFAGSYAPQSGLRLKYRHQADLQPADGLGRPIEVGEEQQHQLLAACPNCEPSRSCGAEGKPESDVSSARGCRRCVGVQDLGCSLERLHRDAARIGIFFPLVHPKLVGGSTILAVVPIGYQPILDAQVPDFHSYKAAGVYHHNSGKTWSAGFELAIHLTGLYPDWWEGKRWGRAINAWASGVTSESTRDNPQRVLLGRAGAWGTGSIPNEAIAGVTRASHGVADAVDSIKVKHVSGGISTVAFKSYEKGREKWQGETLDLVWFDEEPPEDIYSEGLTRTNVGGDPGSGVSGITMMTFTPLLGMSKVVTRFLKEKPPGTHVTRMTIHDSLHYTEDQRAAIIASYPEHERDARALGIPTLGSGRIYPVPESMIKEPIIQIPAHWPRLCAMDFGWDHPTAAVWGAWDRDADCIHIYDAYRVDKQPVIVHAAAVKAKGDWIPVAWPHDGNNDTSAGSALAKQYKAQGLAMLPHHATFPNKPDGSSGGNSVEAGVMDLLDRMMTGRLKVASHLEDWFEEFRLYHRKDGKIVKLVDDLLSATRYLSMQLRFAKTKPKPNMDFMPSFGPLDNDTGF